MPAAVPGVTNSHDHLFLASLANPRTDWRTPECIETLIANGHTNHLLIGGDTKTAAPRSVESGPGMPGLLDGFGRSLRSRIGADRWDAITIVNPARALGLREVPARPLASPG